MSILTTGLILMFLIVFLTTTTAILTMVNGRRIKRLEEKNKTVASLYVSNFQQQKRIDKYDRYKRSN